MPHRMNPIESEEVNQQVKELLNQELIRDSLISGTIPTILIPNKIGEW